MYYFYRRRYLLFRFPPPSLPYSLSGNVADMSATCRPDSQMSALLADTALSCRRKIDPDTTFSCQGWPTCTPFFFLYQPEYVCTHNLPKTSTYDVVYLVYNIHNRAVVDNNNTQQPT